MLKNLKFDYDEKNDLLYLYNDLEYESSIDWYGLVIDFSRDRIIKGTEITDASIFFSELTNKTISKTDLKTIVKSFIDVRETRNSFHVNVGVELKDNSLFEIPIMIPNNI